MAECRQLGNPLLVLMAANAMGTEYRPTHNVRRACLHQADMSEKLRLQLKLTTFCLASLLS